MLLAGRVLTGIATPDVEGVTGSVAASVVLVALLGLGLLAFLRRHWATRGDSLGATSQAPPADDVRERTVSREQASAALRSAEAQLRRMVEGAPAAVAMFDREMRYRMVSRRFAADYHLGPEDLIGKSHYEVFPDLPERWRDIHRRCLAGATERCDEDPFPRADGRVDWVRWEIGPWHDASGEIGGVVLFSEVITARKDAELELVRERERLRVTLRSIGDAVITTDEAGRITAVNPVAEALTGWSVGEALGRPLDEVFRVRGEGGGAPGQNPVERVLREGVVVSLADHSELVGRDGRVCPISDTAAPIRDAAGALLGVVLVFRDRSKEQHSERALATAERRQRFKLHLSDALRTIADPAEIQGTAARILGEALGASRVHYAEVIEGGQVGLVRSDFVDGVASVVGRHHLDSYGPMVMAEVRAGRTLVIEDVACDLRLAHAERERTLALGVGAYVIVPLLKVDRPVALLVAHSAGPRAWSDDDLAILHGTAERTWAAVEWARAEKALRASEQRLSTLFRITPSAHLIARVRDDVILDANDAALEMLGYQRDDLVGRSVSDLSMVASAEQREAILRRTGAGERVLATELQLRRRGGEARDVLVSVTPIELDGEPCRLSAMQDVTDLRRLEEQYRQAQKLESVGRLAGGVAHDFNNLLTVILSAAEALQEGREQGLVASADDVEQVISAGQRASELTRQLLAFARKQVTTPVALDVNAVVRSSEKLLRRVLGEDVEMRVQLAPALGCTLCDKVLLEQVLLNLAVNARDAMPDGGTLTIETELGAGCDEHPDVRPAPAGPPRRWVQLRVSDSGTGIAPEVVARMFEPFFTTKELGKGTGLGLATVHGIVAQSGGHIHVASQPGQGTTFQVCLPQVDAAPAKEVAAPAPAHTRGSETVMLVEDDPFVRAITVRALQGGGYRLLVAADGAAALTLAEHHVGAVDLVVSDVVLPGKSGREVVEALRVRWPGLRALFVSGYTQDALERRGVSEAGNWFLAKPFTPATLLARVREVLDSAAPAAPPVQDDASASDGGSARG